MSGVLRVARAVPLHRNRVLRFPITRIGVGHGGEHASENECDHEQNAKENQHLLLIFTKRPEWTGHSFDFLFRLLTRTATPVAETNSLEVREGCLS